MQVKRVFQIVPVILLLLSLLLITQASAAGTSDNNTSYSAGPVGPVDEVQGNITTCNHTILLTAIAENDTSLSNISDTQGWHDPDTGNTTSGLNNSFQVNNSMETSPGNGSVQTNGSVQAPRTVIVNNSTEIPVSYLGSETGSLTLISTSSPSDSYQPKINGENIVWSTLDPVNQTSGIVLYNITTGNEISLTPPGTLDHVNPAISGNYIVYSGQAPDDPVYRVYLYQIDTATTTLLTSPDDQSYRVSPVISGNYVVWTEFDTGYGRIVLHNLVTNSSMVISPDSTLLDNSLPSISGDFVVWQVMDTSNSTYSLLLHQITTNVTRCIPPSDGSTSQMAPSVSGDRVVYAEGYWGEWDIMEYSISTGECRKISHQKVINNNPQTSVDGDLAAWVDKSEAYGSIFLYDRNNNTVSLLTPADLNYSSKTSPSISGKRIVWECNNIGKIDVFMFTRGPAAENLVADFSVNQTIGASPLVVRFTSLSSGSPITWTWDFGDGSTGTGQEVIHTYANQGIYSVTLTVNNPFYRNATRKVDAINVATAPVAGFSTSINSGPAPLSVQFADLSIGSPVNWSWDFGDGGFDNTTNPVHTYQEPGVYSPRLLVANDFGNNSIMKDNLIVVLPTSHSTSSSGLDGLLVFRKEGKESIALNTTQFGGSYFLMPDNLALVLNPSPESWIKDIVLYSDSNGVFTTTQDGFIVGNISDIKVTTRDIPGGGTGGTEFTGSKLNITLNLKSIPLQGTLGTTSWDGITSNDFLAFSRAIDYAGFVGISGSAYSVNVTTSGIEPAGNVTLSFSVSSSWVEEKGGRNEIYVLRKANDGGLEVLPTAFVGNSTDDNLDYFIADSPHGLSMFVISSLHGSGNPLQLFYLSVSTRVVPPASAGGGGGGGGGSYGGNGNQVTPASEPDSSKGSQPEASQVSSDISSGNNRPSGSSYQQSEVPTPQGVSSQPVNPPVVPPQPTNSIFTIVIEVAAIISVCLLVVFSVYTRNRKFD